MNPLPYFSFKDFGFSYKKSIEEFDSKNFLPCTNKTDQLDE